MAKNRVQVQGVSAPTLKNSIGGVGQTFVSPETNSRGAQIAAALQGIAPVVQQKVDEYQEDVRYVDGLKAKNALGVLTPSINEHMANADYSIKEQPDGSIRRMTADEHFASWAQADQYEEMRQNIGSVSAMQALEASIGQAVAEGYGKGTVAYDQTELRETLSQGLQLDLDNGTPNAVANFDAMLVANNLADRSEAMEIIRDEAAHRMRTTGDETVFEYIEETGMGNGKWKDNTEDLRDSIRADALRKEDETFQREKNTRLKAKYSFEDTIAQMIDADPNVDLSEEISKAIAAGVPNAKRLANAAVKDYASGDITMSATKEANVRDAFFKLNTTAQRDAFLVNNASILSKELKSHLRSNVATFNGYDKDVAFKQQLKLMSDIVEEFGADEDKYHSIVNQFSIDYATWFASDDYQSVAPPQRPAKAQELLQSAAAGLGVSFDDNAFVTLNIMGTEATQRAAIYQELSDEEDATPSESGGTETESEKKARLQAEFDALTK